MLVHSSAESQSASSPTATYTYSVSMKQILERPEDFYAQTGASLNGEPLSSIFVKNGR